MSTGLYLESKNKIKYYTIKGLEVVHEEMLNLLSIIIQICKKNKLQYWVDAGTLIGTVRHKDFIPWDDDTDISILKDDYIKLLNELHKYCEKNNQYFMFFKPEENKHFCNFFASKKKIFQRAKGSLELIPIKIDIRPVNVIQNNEIEIIKNRKLRDLANFYVFGRTVKYSVEELKLFYNTISDKEFGDFYNTEYGLLSQEFTPTLLAHPYYEYSNENFIHYKDIFPLKKGTLRQVEVNIPNRSSVLLNNLYGDFMKLPNLEERKPIAKEIIEFKKERFKYIECLFGFNKESKIKRVISFILLFGIFELIKVLKERVK